LNRSQINCPATPFHDREDTPICPGELATLTRPFPVRQCDRSFCRRRPTTAATRSRPQLDGGSGLHPATPKSDHQILGGSTTWFRARDFRPC
jgi:hypothetical protein